MKVSITLPSLNRDLLTKALVHLGTTIGALDHEIVVVSPFAVDGPNVVWVCEDTPRGNCAAHRTAFAHATGDIIVAMSDDMLPEPGWLSAALSQLLSAEREKRGACVGLHQHLGQLGTVFGIYFPFFPVMFRHTIEAAGGYYSDEFVAHFGDADLGLRVWKMGGRCAPCFGTKLFPVGARDYFGESKDRQQRFLSDMDVFVAKWRESYGRGWSTDHPRDFLLNIYEQAHEAVLENGTIFHNFPEFGAQIRAFYDDHKVDYRKFP